jgi:hypothetical protein
MMRHFVACLRNQGSYVEPDQQKENKLHAPVAKLNWDHTPVAGQSILNRRMRTVSQYNLVDLQKAIDLAG